MRINKLFKTAVQVLALLLLVSVYHPLLMAQTRQEDEGQSTSESKSKHVPVSLAERIEALNQQGAFKDALTILYAEEERGEALKEVYLLMAKVYIAAGNGIAVEAAVDKARANGADYAATSMLYARSLLIQGQFTKAIDALSGVPLKQNDRASAFVILGDAYFALNQLETARAEYLKALKMDKRSDLALLGLARLSLRGDDLVAAEKYVNEAILYNDTNTMLSYTRGLIARYQGRAEEAKAYFKNAVEIYSANLMANLELASISISENKITLAESYLDTVYQASPRNQMAIFLSATIAAKKGDFAEAEALLIRVPSLISKYLPAIYVRGLVAYERQNYDIAIENLTKVIAAKPTNIEARAALAASYLWQENYSLASGLLKPVVRDTEKAPPKILMLAATAASGLGQATYAEELFSIARGRVQNSGQSKTGKSSVSDVALSTKVAIAQFLRGDQTLAIETLSKSLSDHENEIRELGILASMQLRSGRTKDAIITAENIIRTAPDRALGYNIKGSIDLKLGDYQKAIQSFGDALDRNRAYYTAMRNRALAYLRLGQLPEAENELLRLLDFQPNDARAKAILGKVQLISGQFKDAVDNFVSARRVLVNSPDLETDYAEALAKSGRIAGAIDISRSTIKLVQDRPDLIRKLGLVFMDIGKPELAASLLSRYVAFDPSSVDANILYGRSLYQTGLYAGAMQAFDRAEKLANALEKSLISWYRFAIFVRSAREAEALELFDSIKESERPDDIEAGLEGYALLGLGRLGEAITSFKNAIAQNDTASLRLILSDSYLLSGQHSEAITALAAYGSTKIDSRIVLVRLADLYTRFGDIQSAIKTYQTILQDGLADAQILASLSLAYLKVGNADSLSFAERARLLSPDDPFILNTYGWVVLQAQRDIAAALPALEQASRRKPGSGLYKYRLGMALQAKGDKAQARTYFEQALNLDPDFDGAEEARRQLKE